MSVSSASLDRFRVFSGSTLKTIAVVTMLIDHTASVFLRDNPILLFSIRSHAITAYWIMRMIGRLAFPLFCFLLVEGFFHTHSKTRYAANLFLFALLSELPWNLEHAGTWRYAGQNVFFTLFFGLLGLCAIEHFCGQWAKTLFCLGGLFLVARFFGADYGVRGYAFILLLYALRESRILQAVIGSSFFTDLPAALAFIPMNLYNGKRGFIRGSFLKYAFYAIYPVHMLLFYFIKANTIGY